MMAASKKEPAATPSGRLVGSRNKTTLLREQLLKRQASQLLTNAMERASRGNILPQIRFKNQVRLS